jgi:hypothetical protein
MIKFWKLWIKSTRQIMIGACKLINEKTSILEYSNDAGNFLQ